MPADKNHLIFPVDNINAAPFSPKNGGGQSNLPHRRSRISHAQTLKIQLEAIKNAHDSNAVFTIKFIGAYNKNLLFNELEKSSFNMELLSVKETNGIFSANVRVDSAKTFKKFFAALDKYAQTTKDSSMPYISSIEKVEDVKVDDFFTDDISLLPTDNNPHWWEIWLTNKDLSNDDASNGFITAAMASNLNINRYSILFEDRLVFLCEATKTQLSAFIPNCNLIAEIRIAKLLKKPLFDRTLQQQQLVLENLQLKTTYPDNDKTSIVILDGNIITRHPLLNDALIRNQKADLHFSPDNTNEHATEMGGLVLFGDLQKAADLPNITLRHKIEGVQIFDHIQNNYELYGRFIENAVNLTERDDTNNAYILAVSEIDGDKHNGKPTLWSGHIDKLLFEHQKLFAVAVGNISGFIESREYENMQQNSSVESPSHAWNVLSIGAYTELCDANLVSNEGLVPFANFGDISPYSRTSCQFESQWPIKPEVLFEGGNRVIETTDNVITHDAFDLVSCAKDFRTQPFTNINGTSASAGLAGKLIGELMAQYPSLWSETIRGLIVHSAEWTDAMKNKLPNNSTKTARAKLSRMFGYGVPNLERAKYSASNALTLIAQKKFQVFSQKTDRQGVQTNDKISQILMFKLPWPVDILQNELKDTKIKLKITLSYFVKPNPSERGYSNKYAYQSHNLRFDLQRPAETQNAFESRINKLIESEETNVSRQDDSLNWFYGKRVRDKGSIHKDILEINGADLATMQNLAVYSVAGWWKNRKTIPAVETKSRFSLIVDIDAGETNIDLYTEIQNMIEIPIEIPI